MDARSETDRTPRASGSPGRTATPRRARPDGGREATGPDGVLVTKLHLPRPPPGFVRRPRLIDLLDAGVDGELTVVCAPAGFGKTALLTDWIQQCGRPTAWLSLDPGDDDAVRFWRHVLAALDRIRPGIAERVGPQLDPPAPTSFDGVATSVVNDLATMAHDDGPGVSLVLDDYHLIEAEPVHASVQFLVEHAPRGVHVTLTSRADPPLALARLRARRQLTELRAADLRFTSDEAAELLGQVTGSALDADDIATLNVRTEGWAAGLQLAGLSLQGRADVKAFVATFSGSHRYVLDYLAEEVLEAQPPQVRQFLLETSVLDRLSGPLCDAVTGRTDGQQMLEAIEQANLFLVPLDEERRWWRYHHLFADLLRSRLDQAGSERLGRLHARAADWLVAHDHHEDAVRHSVAADDEDRAARLIEERFDELFRSGEQATIRRWLSMLPTDAVRSRPRSCLAEGYVALLTNDLDRLDGSLDAAERVASRADAHPFEPSIGLDASLIVNVPAAIALLRSMAARVRGDLDATRTHAEAALALIHPEERTQGIAVRQQLAVTRWLGGDLDDAERMLSATAAGWQEAGELVMAAWVASALGPVQRAQGRLSAAVETYERLLGFVADPGQAGRLAAEAIAHIGLADIAYERGELESARRHVTEGIDRCRRLSYGPLLSTGLARLAWLHLADGDRDGARRTIEEANEIIPIHGPTEFTPAPVLGARLLLALGDVEEAARWVAGRGLDAADDLDHPREGEHLVLARVLLAQHQPGAALGLLDRLRALATAQRRTASTIEIQVLRALALAARGDRPQAAAALAEALARGRPEGHLRVFVDEGAPMAALVGDLIAAGAGSDTDGAIPLAHLARLARHLRPTPLDTDERSGATATGLVVDLTERERDVLHLLAAGRSNQAIADELYLALNTVKHHVTHILEKLGSTNRTEAVARARELGLLP